MIFWEIEYLENARVLLEMVGASMVVHTWVVNDDRRHTGIEV